MFLWDLSRDVLLSIVPIIEAEKQIFEVFKQISCRIEKKTLLIFDNLFEISLKICELLTALDLSFVIFSKNKNILKFEKLNCPLSRKNNVISNKNDQYKNSFDRIEILKENLTFDDFVFLIERSNFAEKHVFFTFNDKNQLEKKYRKMKEFIEGINEVKGILQGFGEEALEKVMINPNWREHCVNVYLSYGNFMEKNQINCSFEYFLENYVF